MCVAQAGRPTDPCTGGWLPCLWACLSPPPSSLPSLPQVDQAALTGESLPVKKFSGAVAFAGSTIKQVCMGARRGAGGVLGAGCMGAPHAGADVWPALPWGAGLCGLFALCPLGWPAESPRRFVALTRVALPALLPPHAPSG